MARDAEIKASSTAAFERLEGDIELFLGAKDKEPEINYRQNGAVVFIPAESYIDAIDLCFAGPAGAQVSVDLYQVNRPQNYRLDTLVINHEITVCDNGWTQVPAEIEPGEGRKIGMRLTSEDDVCLCASADLIPGAAAANILYWQSMHGEDEQWGREVSTPLFRVHPAQNLLRAENVVNGYNRPEGLPYLWVSEPMCSGKKEWLELQWKEPKRISCVELIFDSQLNGEKRLHSPAATLVRDYRIIAKTANGNAIVLAEITGNCQRRRKHICTPVETGFLRLEIIATHGASSAAVYEVRAR